MGNGRAVVIGASLAGLLAARALHESFEEVVVLDRDTLPQQPEPRRGVPQSSHVHGLLTRGSQEMERLFDGFGAELAGLGAPTFDVQDDMRWWLGGRPLAKGVSGMTALAASRPLLEFVIRRRVQGLANVVVRPEHTVDDLLCTAQGDRVVGVTATAAGQRVSVDDADLVVDASGRGSRSRHMLTALGFPQVEEERIEVPTVYVTRRYRREPHHLDGRAGASVNAYPGNVHGGFVLAQENDTWIVSISDRFGGVPPTDDDGMLAFAETLDSPDVATIMRTAEPIGDPVKMRYPASTRLRYDRIDQFPAGYLVTGDAMCSFNPIYGQGMTVAALEAGILRRLLKDGTTDLASRFFAAAAAVIDVPWAAVAANDLRLPKAVGDRSMLDQRRGAYLERLRRAATEDPVLATAFLRVTHLMDPPSALFAPEIAGRVPA
ncbi:squalene monooxygenase [Micromonospora sp. WMMD710]|uniref:squalene monooxygenase n=1 Tax=Micromonospora sp. WMMD710 TaxID=3016085 RepID=UPI002417B1D6|nr:squalene monooxygenase [Micromonospora sp. WMMD710]MDG4757346.1 squalene monooxygenase [Micromonospora sp. WMMD710]